MLKKVSAALAVLVGAFVFWTSGAGPFESLIQRAIFLALVVCLGLTLYPRWALPSILLSRPSPSPPAATWW